MSNKFKNKYRIPSARLQRWDYGWDAAYFITICTKGKEHYFGHVVKGEMILSEIGMIAHNYWLEIPQHFSFVELGSFVVMPNHVHGVLILNNNGILNGDGNVETPNLGVSKPLHLIHTNGKPDFDVFEISSDTNVQETPRLGVSTGTVGASNKWKSGNLGVIINQYKRKCTIDARKINNDFVWQTRYHDHIIRNDVSFQRISEYIINNVRCWGEDGFNKDKGM